LHFGQEPPRADGGGVPVWIRDGWSDSEKNVTHDAHEAGPESPVVFVFLPRHESDPLRESIAAWKAAEKTLEHKGVPTSNEGLAARKSMETRRDQAQRRVDEFIGGVLNAGRVYQGGGNEVTGVGLAGAVEQAANRSLDRLYPEFDDADSPQWHEVLRRARDGDAGCLAVLNHQGEIPEHPVCREILNSIGAGRKGREIRQQFRSAPYGWSQDAVDGALLALVVSDHLHATENGTPLTHKALDQTKIGVAHFHHTSVVLTTQQRIDLRTLMQAADVKCRPNEETAAIPGFIDLMLERAQRAGGDAPAPARPSVVHLEDIQHMVGNELALALWKMRERVAEELEEWEARAQAIEARMPRWEALQDLLRHARGLPVAEEVAPQAEAILQNRALLDEPDPITPLCDRLADALRQSVNEAHAEFEQVHVAGMESLVGSDAWQQLDDGQRSQIASACALDVPEAPRIATEAELLNTLDHASLADWRDRTDALPQRFGNAMLLAAKVVEPEAVRVQLPQRTLSSAEDVDAWVEEVRALLLDQINAGRTVVL